MVDINTLEQNIRKYAEAYYAGRTEISDEEFDDMVDTLRSIDPDSPILAEVGWGSGVEKIEGDKKPHIYGLVGSLPKYKTIESLPNYVGLKCISAKLDGMSCVLYYENGKLQYALTRGNGKEGVDRTKHLLEILDKDTLTKSDFTGSIRGELVISSKNWNRLLEKYPEYNVPDKNPRNIGAGFIRRNDITEDIEYMSFVPYDVLADSTHSFSNQEAVYKFLEENFDEVCPMELRDSASFDDLEEIYNKFSKQYPCDGLVYGESELTFSGINVIYHQVAFKFNAETKEAVINGIEWNITRTGRLTPVVLIDTIQLSGTSVSRATAYNARYVVDNGIEVGKHIMIQKSNEIIPKIIKVL